MGPDPAFPSLFVQGADDLPYPGGPVRVVQEIRRMVTQVVGEMKPLRVHPFGFAETFVEIARIAGQGEKVDVFHGNLGAAKRKSLGGTLVIPLLE
jgi:hypothetical protein